MREDHVFFRLNTRAGRANFVLISRINPANWEAKHFADDNNDLRDLLFKVVGEASGWWLAPGS
ncbi:MAG: hypothetical protein RMJ16_15045 [Thermoguttaceae bacterium]|nr:hypothetical protein [Thermoguttaceae bacterium]